MVTRYPSASSMSIVSLIVSKSVQYIVLMLPLYRTALVCIVEWHGGLRCRKSYIFFTTFTLISAHYYTYRVYFNAYMVRDVSTIRQCVRWSFTKLYFLPMNIYT
jgi:hypothetical protein